MAFHYTHCLMGILILAYYNPYLTGWYNPQCTLKNIFSIAQMILVTMAI